MSVKYFLDTNILLYAASGTSAEEEKRRISYSLIEAGGFGISAQVLQEFYVNAVRKAKLGMPPKLAFEWLEQLDHIPCHAMDRELVKLGIETSDRYQISYWDGAIVAAAQEMGAEILYSEDLNHDQSYGSVKVINPFLELE